MGVHCNTPDLHATDKKMISTKILSIFCIANYCFCAPAPDPNERVKRQDETKNSLIVTKFHVNTKIRFRYAITTVTSYIKNPGTEAKKADFSMTIPDTAFISNMSMTIKEKEYVSEVKEKAEAKEEFEEAVVNGAGAGLVSKVSRDSSVFSVDANVEPGDKVVFRLTYEELLERRNGRYEYAININPGQVVEDFRVIVNINESLPLTDLKGPKIVETNEIGFDEEEVNEVAEVTLGVNSSDHNALIAFAPDQDYQETAGDQGVSGKFIISYDVDRSNQESEVQVIDGYFVHYFVPENLQTLPKHVVYVLDVSGSMTGQKLEQMKDAMFTVLDDMKDTDFFNIITFSSQVSQWKKETETDISSELTKDSFSAEPATESYPATAESKNLAISSVLDLESGGSTNIDDALKQALQVGQDAKKKENIPRDVPTMIVFLTDGLPNGDTATIRSNVKTINKESEIPIFAIGFGAEADFNFLKKIASENDGVAKKIYEGSDAALQLEDFYAQIASPLLSNLKFNYVGDIVDNSSISEAKTRTIFRGNDFIVTGKLSDEGKFGIQINGTGRDIFEREILICLRSEDQRIDDGGLKIFPNKECIVPPVHPMSESQNFLKKLYAFTNINQLLNKIELTSNETEKLVLEKRATTLALENNLVTDLTSLVVIKPDTDPVINELATDRGSGLGESVNLRAYSYFTPYSSRSSPSLSASTGGLSGTVVSSGVRKNFDPSFGHFSAGGLTGVGVSTTSYYDYDYDYYDATQSNTTTVKAVVEACNGTLTLFTKTYNRGEEIEITKDVEDLTTFDNKAVTAAVSGTCCWNIFSESNFSGVRKTLRPGEAYTGANSLGRELFRNVSSVRKQEVKC